MSIAEDFVNPKLLFAALSMVFIFRSTAAKSGRGYAADCRQSKFATW